jgi:hypothetical protein
MTVRLITRHITTVSLTIVAILLPITGTTNSENNGLSGITLRGVLSNGDLVLGQHRQNSLASSSSSGLQGSSGSGLRGSSGSGLRGSSGSGLRGSSGSGLRGSSGSGLRGSSGSGLRGSSGSGLRGSSGSGLRGSSGSGLRGSSGSGLRGSSGSGLRGSSGSGLRGSGGSGLPAFRGEPRYISSFDELPLLAVGPISEISTDGNIVEVLGQNIIIDDKTILITFDLNGELISIKEGLKNLDNFNKDDYMAAAGDLVDPGLQLGTILIKLPRRFTEGASLVYVRTILDSVDLSVGRALSGSTLIDFSATLYNTRNSLAQPGNVVEYFGYTYANHKSLVATSGNIVGRLTDKKGAGHTVGSSGSGLRGSSGSGLRGSSGSGLRGSSGSGFK